MTHNEAILAVKATLTAYRKGIISLGEFYRDLGATLVAREQAIIKADESAEIGDVAFDVLTEAGYYNHD